FFFFTPSIFLGYGLFLLSENRRLNYFSIIKRAAIFIGIFLICWLVYIAIIPYGYDKMAGFNSRSIEGVYQTEYGDSILIRDGIVSRPKEETKNKSKGHKYELLVNEEPKESLIAAAMHFYLAPNLRGFKNKLTVN